MTRERLMMVLIVVLAVACFMLATHPAPEAQVAPGAGRFQVAIGGSGTKVVLCVLDTMTGQTTIHTY